MKLLTANRLADGKVIWFTGRGWSEAFGAAVRLDAEAAAAALEDAQGQPRELVGPYLIAVEDDAVERRERLRERIRAGGPTVGHSLQA